MDGHEHDKPPDDGGNIERNAGKTIRQKRVTYDFHRLMEGATRLDTSESATAIIENT